MKRIFLIIIPVLILGGLALYIYKWEYREPVLEVYFLHLNKGRGIYIRTPHGRTLLIDGGQNSEIVRELTKVLPFYRRRLDTVMFTSAQAKNVGGLIEVLGRYEVDKIVRPGILGTSTALDALEKLLLKKSIHTENVLKGDSFEIDGITFTVLFPDPDFKYNKTSVAELVLRVDYGETTLLFLGDVSKTIQKQISKEVDAAYLIEFAHGATKSRVSADLLEKLNPKVIVSSSREETQRFVFK